jgi:hypothetical protein
VTVDGETSCRAPGGEAAAGSRRQDSVGIRDDAGLRGDTKWRKERPGFVKVFQRLAKQCPVASIIAIKIHQDVVEAGGGHVLEDALHALPICEAAEVSYLFVL